MKCPPLQIIEDYLNGDVPVPQRPELEAHIAKCPTCRAILDQERRLGDLLHAAIPLQAPPQLRVMVLQDLDSIESVRTLPEWLWALGMGVAVILVGLFLGMFANPYLGGLKKWVTDHLLQADLLKSFTDLNNLPASDWLSQFPAGSSMMLVNLGVGGVILCWGLWQMLKALRR
jgi:hypothetical protein